jgi:hypothetical protein
LELYDHDTDAQERNNLGSQTGRRKAAVERINGKLNQLIATEIGTDDGAALPGPTFLWRL